MTTRNELDAVDRKILRILGTDGRASYQAIADDVGLSRPAVMERVKRLEESGHIAGYHARVDRARAGFPVTALDRKSTRLNSSHSQISYAVFCLKKKNRTATPACSYYTVTTTSLTSCYGKLAHIPGVSSFE